MSLFAGRAPVVTAAEALSQELAHKLAQAEELLEKAESRRILALAAFERSMRLIREGTVVDGYRRQDTEALNALLDGWTVLKKEFTHDVA